MKKKHLSLKKLSLTREIITPMTVSDESKVKGGATADASVCVACNSVPATACGSTVTPTIIDCQFTWNCVPSQGCTPSRDKCA